MDKEIYDKLKIYSEIVKEHIDCKKILLYGSYAKGTQKEYSDIDVAVIVEEVDNVLESDFLLHKLTRNIDPRIEPITLRETDSFYDSIKGHSEVVYQKQNISK